MSGMDIRKIQPTIDALNAEIESLTSARDTLVMLLQGTKKKPTTSVSTNRSAAQRKRWAEQKRKQRAAAKKAVKK